MPFTQSDVDALKAAIVAGKGARSITFSDQSVTFHTVDEMLKLLAVMQQDVNAAGSSPKHYRLAATSKGV
jgi:hypothetical protein